MIKEIRIWWKDIREDIKWYGIFTGLRKNLPGNRYFDKAYYWIRYRTWARYHIIDTKLPPGYHDKDQLMIYGCFSLLVDYVEKEKCFEVIEWESDPGHSADAKEIRSLYDWWKNVRPNRKDPIHDVGSPNRKKPVVASVDEDGDPATFAFGEYDDTPEKIAAWNDACKRSHKLEEEWNQEDEQNLIRLMRIRLRLWT